MQKPGPTFNIGPGSLLLEELNRSRDLGFLGPKPAEEQYSHSIRLVEFFSDCLSTVVGYNAGAAEKVTQSSGIRPFARPAENHSNDTAVHSAADLGSGGGVPGLVFASEISHFTWVFVERSENRSRFLRGSIRRLGLNNAEVFQGDTREAVSEKWAPVEVVTARSYGPPELLISHARPLLVRGGLLVISDPPNEDMRWSPEILGGQFELVATQNVPIAATCLRKL